MIRFLDKTPQMGEQVSNDVRHSNANLVEHPSPEWHPSSERPSRKYHWKTGERAADGLKRIIAAQLQLAILELSADRGELDYAVHEARKCLKKCRSALRLLQNILGKEYKQGNVVLRDAGRRLSPVRDSQALIEMFDKLSDECRDDLGARNLISIRNALVRRKNRLAHEFQQKGIHAAVLKTLRTFATRVDKWKFNKAELPVLSKSLARTLRRNRQACQMAYAESRAESFHEWRKRAKDLRYHLNLVSKAWFVLGDFACRRLRAVSANRCKSPLLTAIPHTRFACDGLHGTAHLFWAEEYFSGTNQPVRINQKRLILFSHFTSLNGTSIDVLGLHTPRFAATGKAD